jgi:hypothetical protein
MNIIPLISICFGVVSLIILVYFSIVSKREEEPLAAGRALMLAFIVSALFIGAGYFDVGYSTGVSSVLLTITLLVIIIILLPVGNKPGLKDDTPNTRIDERDIMFSRMLLKEGTERFN